MKNGKVILIEIVAQVIGKGLENYIAHVREEETTGEKYIFICISCELFPNQIDSIKFNIAEVNESRESIKKKMSKRMDIVIRLKEVFVNFEEFKYVEEKYSFGISWKRFMEIVDEQIRKEN